MSRLFEIVRSDDHAKLAELLAAGVDLNAMDDANGESALAIAAGRGDFDMVKLLLDAGADPNSPYTTAWPLSRAAIGGHASIVELLLDREAEVDAVDEEGATALSDAAAAGHEEIVELLLEAGANVRQRDSYGRRPISYAAEKGHVVIVEQLGPLSTPTDCKEAKSLLAKCERGPVDSDVKAFHEAIWKCNEAGIEAYLQSGRDPDATDERGRSAIFNAANRGNLSLIKRLESMGANLARVDDDGTSALYYAALSGNAATFDYLYAFTPKNARLAAERLSRELIKAGRWN